MEFVSHETQNFFTPKNIQNGDEIFSAINNFIMKTIFYEITIGGCIDGVADRLEFF
jgi:hypothetical protein